MEQAGTLDEEDEAFYKGKIQTCLFFFRHELPKTEALAEVLKRGDDTVECMKVEWF